MEQPEADATIHEDQLLDFVVNLLTATFSLSLGANADLDPEDIFEVLVGACVDGTSVSSLCENSEDAPPGNDILYHLRTKFDLDPVELVGNVLLQTNVLEVFPEKAEFVVDFHLRPYYGDEDDTTGLYHSHANAGTTAFHAYATLYTCVRDKRYTLALRRLEDGDTPSQVLAEFFGILETLDVSVRAIYLDREFYDSPCLTLLQAHNFAYVLPIVKWGQRIKRELSTVYRRIDIFRTSQAIRLDG